MAKPKKFYQCQACGYITAKWMGRCSDCGEWNTLVEEVKTAAKGRGLVSGGRAEPVPLNEIGTDTFVRVMTGIGEFDRVLGGGIVPGSVVLIGGDPGIGKSTLVLQVVSMLKGGVLYVSGEESPDQIKLRAGRLQITSGTVALLAENSLEHVTEAAGEMEPTAVVIDSIQTM